jgi:RNA polymerase sigma-70 factor (ECF subfamily)
METQRATENSDRDLADRVLELGDETAFRELYRRHTPRLLGFVTRLLGRTDAEAEDVAQETWIRVCRALDGFRWDSGFSTWLLGIGLNVARDHMRRSARSKSVQLEELPDQPVPAAASDQRIDLERAIRLLPDGYRTVLVLHDVEGMTHNEIAERLAIAPGTSKSQLSNARRMVRSALTKPSLKPREMHHDERRTDTI